MNPLAVARYRDRHQVSVANSDAGDAKLLADLVRTNRHNHRPIAGDSPDAEAIKVLASGHQNLIRGRTNRPSAAIGAARSTTRPRRRCSTTCMTATRWPYSDAPRLPPRPRTRPCLRSDPPSKGLVGNAGLDTRARDIQTALQAEHLTAPATVAAAFATTPAPRSASSPS